MCMCMLSEVFVLVKDTSGVWHSLSIVYSIFSNVESRTRMIMTYNDLNQVSSKHINKIRIAFCIEHFASDES
jgi:hypothetical protein